ncbi:cell wall hydrolase [Sphingomonas sp. LY160]|uniref:cell wall hydrolase n=1 Tax=Sphingomonas sp. LY160 TaxID=3095342 RepID=UPI002ADEB541|nr:cell wall hydrolase [Sphingomonas sp. LY160]MEA1072710.1 cell wall hydrolase [Sphingomonas sp. LY160]
MTAAKIVRSRLAVGGMVIAALLAVVGGASFTAQPTRASAPVAALIAPGQAAKLVDATSGEHLVDTRATGDKAKLINASMPFAGGPIAAARPFDLSDADPTDHRRALLCLTQAVYYEAGFEPVDGRRAVAQVVLNRMRHPAFPKSVCGVVYQGARQPVCQFSFTCDGSLYRAPALGAWKQAEAVAKAALAGYVERSVGAATHYHADYVAPYWAPMLSKISKLGAHIFYRWPGAWGSTAAFTGRYIGEPADPSALRPPLRQAALSDGTVVPAEEVPVVAGPPIARAPNDVGGLLDTSKGWTLSIPMPSETGAASKAIAVQQAVPTPVPAAPAAVIAAR